MSLAFCISPPFPHRSTRPRYAQKPFNVVSSIQLILLSTESDQVGTSWGPGLSLIHFMVRVDMHIPLLTRNREAASFIYLIFIYLQKEENGYEKPNSNLARHS